MFFIRRRRRVLHVPRTASTTHPTRPTRRGSVDAVAAVARAVGERRGLRGVVGVVHGGGGVSHLGHPLFGFTCQRRRTGPVPSGSFFDGVDEHLSVLREPTDPACTGEIQK